MMSGFGRRPLIIAKLMSFAILVGLSLAYGITLAFVYLASGAARAGTYIWFAMLISVVLYFRWPWVAVRVSWVEMARGTPRLEIVGVEVAQQVHVCAWPKCLTACCYPCRHDLWYSAETTRLRKGGSGDSLIWRFLDLNPQTVERYLGISVGIPLP